MNDEIVHASIYLPRPLHRALKVKLAGEGKSLSEWAREHAAADTKPPEKRRRNTPTA